jgi:transcriptional regulator with XRE-family HTH domain
VARQPVGSKIKEAREATNLSAFDFSKIAKIPFSRFAAIEAGKAVATEDEVWRIAEAFVDDPSDANPIVFYEPASDEYYRGNRGRIASPVTQAEQQAMFARDQDQRRQAQLRQWIRSATASEISQGAEQVKELQALDLKLDGQSSIDASWAKTLGVEEPADRSVADHQRASR